jgi:hypothetical protein
MPAFPVRPVAAVLLGVGLGVAAVVVAGREPPIAPEPKRGWAQGAGLQQLLRPNPQAARRCAAKLAIRERPTPADPTNFGERRPTDAEGGLVPNQPSVIVLHETVMSLGDTLRFFQTPHPRDADQASYHLLLDSRGMAYRLVPDAKRAFGSGWSAWGDGSIRHRPLSSPLAGGSINNVALHLSLESPADGRGDDDAHSGYSRAQYERLAEHVLIWQLRWGIPMRRITTHAAVDRSHSRRDPRSFRWERFDRAWLQAASSCGISAEGPYGLDAMPQI